MVPQPSVDASAPRLQAAYAAGSTHSSSAPNSPVDATCTPPSASSHTDCRRVASAALQLALPLRGAGKCCAAVGLAPPAGGAASRSPALYRTSGLTAPAPALLAVPLLSRLRATRGRTRADTGATVRRRRPRLTVESTSVSSARRARNHSSHAPEPREVAHQQCLQAVRARLAPAAARFARGRMSAALEVELPRAAPRASESHAHRDDDAADDATQELLQSGLQDAAVGGLRGTFAGWVSPERAVTASWVVNWALFLFKIVAFISSNSKAVLASLADSAVDLASQYVLAAAQRHIKLHDTRYPVGRARLEAFAVLACGTIMVFASLEVVQFSIADLWRGMHGERPRLSVDAVMFTILGVGIAAKGVLWVICSAAAQQHGAGGGTLEALAEDHLNDVWSNAGAVIAGAIAGTHAAVWWLDPVGGIVISAVIILRWLHLSWEQVKQVTGHTAPPEFIQLVNAIALAHSTLVVLDVSRAYHVGSRYNVEMEIVLPGDLTVSESHDIALGLQHKIEELKEVERAFVHVDYQSRDAPEHKVERLLLAESSSSISSLQQRGARANRSAQQLAV